MTVSQRIAFGVLLALRFAAPIHAQPAETRSYKIDQCLPTWPVGGAGVRLFLESQGVVLSESDVIISSVRSSSIVIKTSGERHASIEHYVGASSQLIKLLANPNEGHAVDPVKIVEECRSRILGALSFLKSQPKKEPQRLQELEAQIQLVDKILVKISAAARDALKQFQADVEQLTRP